VKGAARGAGASGVAAPALAAPRVASLRKPVPSPCISVCRIDPASGLCEGCLRTLDEIARWGSMNDEARLSVREAIDARRERHDARAATPAEPHDERAAAPARRQRDESAHAPASPPPAVQPKAHR